MLIKLELDHGGLAEVLKVNSRAMVDEAARSIAGAVTTSHPDAEEVEIEQGTTDRARATVIVKDARAAGWQARDGILTRAAAAQGLEVKSS